MLKILLPLDGSELAERAIPHAYALAKSIVANVTLLRVVNPAEFRNEDAFNQVDWRLGKQQARSYLKGVAETFETVNIPFELRVEEGHAAEVIIQTARDLGAHLLIMSTHGRGAAIDFPQGGVVSKVLSTYDGSVCLVGARSVQLREPKAPYQRLLVPIDGSHESECALRVAMSLAKGLEAQLTVVCVAEAPEVPSIIGSNKRAQDLCHEVAEMTRIAAARKLEELKARVSKEISLRTFVILIDRSTNPVVEVAHRFNPDLLVTGMLSTNRVKGPYASATQIASAVGDVPILLLSPKGVGDAFSEPSNNDPPDFQAADVS